MSKNIHAHYEAITSSTNSVAKTSEVFPTITLADTQTEGRGRGENSWSNTKPGSALLSTWSFETNAPPQPVFTARLGLIVFQTLQSLGDMKALSLKAPNDIYLGEAKLAGLLVEVESRGYSHRVHMGLGLNIFDSPDLEDQTTEKLSSEYDVTQESWIQFCNEFWKSLLELVDTAGNNELSAKECSELLMALENYPENAVTKVSPDGSLTINNDFQANWTAL